VALPNLERIVGATLRLANRPSFRTMSLRDLSRATAPTRRNRTAVGLGEAYES
jgi:hypothetical protein